MISFAEALDHEIAALERRMQRDAALHYQLRRTRAFYQAAEVSEPSPAAEEQQNEPAPEAGSNHDQEDSALTGHDIPAQEAASEEPDQETPPESGAETPDSEDPATFDAAVAELLDVVAEAPTAEAATAEPVRVRTGKAGNPQHTPWTQEHDDRVVAMWNEGASAAKIAKDLGRTYGAVVQRMVLLKERGVTLIAHGPGGHGDGPAAPWTPDDDRRLVSMRAKGATFSEIGNVIGRTDGACRLRAKKLEQTVPVPSPALEGEAPPPETEPIATPQPAEPAASLTPRAEPLPALRAQGTIPAPRPVALVTAAIREVSRSDRPLLGDTRIEKAPPVRPGTSDLRRRIAAHLDQLGHTGGWTPLRDLDLFEGVCAARLPDTARRLDVSQEAAASRFKLLCEPIRDPRHGNSPEGQIVMHEVLRERAASSNAVAAE